MLNTTPLNTTPLNSAGSSGVVQAQHESVYTLRAYVTGEHKARYNIGEFPAAQHEAEYHLLGRIHNQHEAEYNLLAEVAAQHEAPYASKLATQHEALYKIIIAAQHAAPITYTISQRHQALYSINTPVSGQHEAEYRIMDRVVVMEQHEALYGARLAASHESIYSLFGEVSAQHEAVYGLNTQVSAQHQSSFDLLAYNPVRKQHKSIWNIGQAEVTNITDVPYIMKDGKRIEIVESSISQDEEGYAWSGTAVLANFQDYADFNYNDEFVINLYGEEFKLILDTKTLTRTSPAVVDMEVEGISPAAMYASPRSEQITKVWETPRIASELCEELLEQTIEWNLVDWTIPAFRLGVNNISPIEVVHLIAEAAGGVVESNPDGSIVVRHKFPVSIPQYPTTAPDQSYTDESDNISVSDGLNFLARINKVVIRDQEEAAQTDRVVYDRETETNGTLHVYPSPFRDMKVTHTGPSSAVLDRVGITQRQETEVIEIYGGSGSTQYPILAVDNIEWKYENLGGVTFEGTEVRATAGDGYSLLEITYTTRSVVYNVQHNENEKVQFLVEDI